MLHEEERILPKYILGLVSVITVILHILNSKAIQQYQIELFGTEVDLSGTNHVSLDRLFLLSNLTWRRAHVTAELTGRDPNVKVNVLRRFH